jgi:hypothetical protein
VGGPSTLVAALPTLRDPDSRSQGEILVLRKTLCVFLKTKIFLKNYCPVPERKERSDCSRRAATNMAC